MGKTIDVADAMALEEMEQVSLRNARTRRAINNTYGVKSPTKKRRKLPGNRKWKDKDAQYVELEGQMAAKEFNARQDGIKALKNIEKQRAKQKKKHSLY